MALLGLRRGLSTTIAGTAKCSCKKVLKGITKDRSNIHRSGGTLTYGVHNGLVTCLPCTTGQVVKLSSVGNLQM